MAQMLVRDLSPEVVERLKERAVERQVSAEGRQGYPGGGGEYLYDGGSQGGYRRVAGALRGTQVQ